MKEKLREVLDRAGLLGLARRGRRTFLSHRPGTEMKFPTYGEHLGAMIRASSDPVRFASMALAIRTEQRCNIQGDFAEVGVYRGDTSSFLIQCAPERTLFLFDTFEGFPLEDCEVGNRGDSRFRDTSVDTLRRAVKGHPNAAIRKGRFPETTSGLEGHRFAFVLLDLDLYHPTLEGLEFFYPRMAPGAYVFVHDYNSPESSNAGARAVDGFLMGKPERPIEIPDLWGSIVFRRLG